MIVSGDFQSARFLFIFRADRAVVTGHFIFFSGALLLLLKSLTTSGESKLWRDTLYGIIYVVALALVNEMPEAGYEFQIYNIIICVVLIILGYGVPSLYILITLATIVSILQDSFQYEKQHALTIFSIGILSILHAAIVSYYKNQNELLVKRLSKSNWAATEFVKANTKLQYDAALGHEKGRLSERVRLAREIHDSVGHSLTAMLMQIRIVRKIALKDPQELELLHKEIEELEKTTVETLTDVRREVSTLREENTVVLSWLVRWKDLCRKFADATGIQLLLSIPDTDEVIHDSIGSGVFRILQESMTNAIRHGCAGTIDIVIQFRNEQGEVYLRISDNGLGTNKIIPGNGLIGIRERVQELCGEVAWQSGQNKGFDLGIRLPLKEESWK